MSLELFSSWLNPRMREHLTDEDYDALGFLFSEVCFNLRSFTQSTLAVNIQNKADKKQALSQLPFGKLYDQYRMNPEVAGDKPIQ